MKTTTRLLSWLLSTSAAVAAALPITSLAQPSQVDADAVQLLRRSTDYLGKMKQFRADADTTIEAVLPNGQKLQLGHRVAVTVQRPNKMRVERVGEVANQTFYYDGKTLVMDLPDQKFYATSPAPSTLDETLDFARDKLDVLAPGSDLIYKNAFERLTEGLTSAYIVGKAVVAGVRCDHLAFRNAEVDWQIWIQEGDKPLPRKYVVTSKRMPESPQFAVVIAKWDAEPKINDATFRLAQSKASRQIEFVLSPTLAAAKK